MTSAGEYEIRGDDAARANGVSRSVTEASSRARAVSSDGDDAPGTRPGDGFGLAGVGNAARRMWRSFTWREASGAMGDLGTFLPLLVGMSIENGVDAGTTILFTGAYNVATAFLYEIPMPVQPMKTIAAVALGEDPLTTNEILVAGFFVSAIVFALGATKTMDAFNRLTPSAVVQGMQVGLGMLLARKGFVLAVYASSDASRARKMTGVDGLLVTIVAFCGVMYACAPEYPPASTAAGADAGELGATTEAKERKKRARHYVPTALILVVVGIVMAMTKKGALSGLRFGPSTPKVLNASRAEVRRGIVRAGVPQLPLTTLNSVISVCALSKELFPDLPASPSSVATSVGVMNVVGCWLGAMPSCHGAGGLAAQYAFGARGGGSIAFLGACKLILGFVFGSSLTHLLDRFPKNILGVMLFSSSLELMGMGLKTKPGWQQHQKYLVMVTAAVTVATKSTAIGFAAGAGTHVLMEVQRRVETGSSMT